MAERSGGKVIKTVIIALIAFLIIFYIAKAFYSPVTTDSCVYYETYNGIDITAVAIRDEQVLTTNKNGIINYDIEDGGKVSKGGTVADIYSTEQDAANEKKIEELESLIADLEEIQNYNNMDAVDIDIIDSKINNSLLSVINCGADGKISEVSKYSSELLKQLNHRQLVVGVSTDFTSLIRSYKSELNELKGVTSGKISSVESKTSGYFVSAIDGYETVIDSKEINDITPKMLDTLKPAVKDYSGTVVGKIVSDYEWYLAAAIPLDDCLKLSEGESYTIKTKFDSCKELPATVVRINKGSSGDKAVVVFECTYMNSDLATMRSQDMTVVLETYSGLKINSKAVRFEDGVCGTYVVTGKILNFVPINILYSTDSYCICEALTTGDRLKLYDEVVLKGKGLYDGKVIG